MGSLHDTVTWYKTSHAGWQKNATASKNKAISTSQAWLFFVIDVPVRSLPSSRADFTPCDSFMQRAHSRLTDCFQLMSRLFCLKKTRLESQIWLRSSLVDRHGWFQMQSKLNIKNMICQSWLRLCISLNDPAILRDKRKKTTKMIKVRASQKWNTN